MRIKFPPPEEILWKFCGNSAAFSKYDFVFPMFFIYQNTISAAACGNFEDILRNSRGIFKFLTLPFLYMRIKFPAPPAEILRNTQYQAALTVSGGLDGDKH